MIHLPNFGLKAISGTSSTGLCTVGNVPVINSSKNDCHCIFEQAEPASAVVWPDQVY